MACIYLHNFRQYLVLTRECRCWSQSNQIRFYSFKQCVPTYNYYYIYHSSSKYSCSKQNCNVQSANSSCLAPIHIVIIDTKIGSSLSLGLLLPSSEILTKLGTESEMSSLKRKTWKPHLVVPLLLVKSGSSRTRISQQKLFWQLKDLSDDGVTIPLKIHFL